MESSIWRGLSSLMNRVRCLWSTTDPLLQQYHDEEWGLPQREERALFELLCLEGAQAGLSWRTILHKRAAYREVFYQFDPLLVANIDERQQQALRQDARIIRHEAKIRAFVENAKIWVAARGDGMDWPAYLWSFVGGEASHPGWQDGAAIPAETDASLAMSHALRKMGFRFVGPKICYAFMQVSGMVNDHVRDCFRFSQIIAL